MSFVYFPQDTDTEKFTVAWVKRETSTAQTHDIIFDIAFLFPTVLYYWLKPFKCNKALQSPRR